jgi:hypothetical protein
MLPLRYAFRWQAVSAVLLLVVLANGWWDTVRPNGSISAPT